MLQHANNIYKINQLNWKLQLFPYLKNYPSFLIQNKPNLGYSIVSVRENLVLFYLNNNKKTLLDGGSPSRSNTTQLLVNVKDVNDNAPRFYTSLFQESVSENVPVGYSIVRVSDEKSCFIRVLSTLLELFVFSFTKNSDKT